MLWVRRLDAVQAYCPALNGGRRLTPFWSPDSRFIAYEAGGKLRKIDSAGGTPQVVADAPALQGGTWNWEGLILFGSPSGPLYQVSASGGVPKPLLALDNGSPGGSPGVAALPAGRTAFPL